MLQNNWIIGKPSAKRLATTIIFGPTGMPLFGFPHSNLGAL
jgi:hypothetical protein